MFKWLKLIGLRTKTVAVVELEYGRRLEITGGPDSAAFNSVTRMIRDADPLQAPQLASVLHHGARPLAGRVRTGFEGAVRDAGLPDEITPHWMRHTCATWLMERDVKPWEAAGYTGMSTKTLEDCYGHHRPTHQANARKALR